MWSLIKKYFLKPEESNINSTYIKNVANYLYDEAKKRDIESFIIMLGMPDGEEHSEYYVVSHGRCLLVRGLLEIGSEKVRNNMKFKEYT